MTSYTYNVSSDAMDINNTFMIEKTDTTTSTKRSKLLTQLYTYVVPVFIIICIVSMIINSKIAVASNWLRKPISPNLKINLSLAAADAYSSFCIGFGFFINSWLPATQLVIMTNICPVLFLEGLRLGGIITVVLHILFLSINHYAGIMKPLHYNGIITSRYTHCTLACLWISPPIGFLTYFALQDNDGFNTVNCDYQFMVKQNFRIMFSVLFFAPFVLMVYIYLKIYTVVKKHHQMRDRYTHSNASLMTRDSAQIRTNTVNLQRNLKAIHTTLLMLGSYLIGWLPGLIYFVTVCKNCALHFDDFSPITTFYICMITNMCIILKTLMNPIIYAARISDMKVASAQMNNAIKNKWNSLWNRNPNNTLQMRDYQGPSTEYSDITTRKD